MGPLVASPESRPGVPLFKNDRERFAKIVQGHWLDSIGHSIIVSKSEEIAGGLTAVLTPLIDHPDARDRVLSVAWRAPKGGGGGQYQWSCGNSCLEFAGEEQPGRPLSRLIWITEDGRRSVWSRSASAPGGDGGGQQEGGGGTTTAATWHGGPATEEGRKSESCSAFPWLLNNAAPEPWLPLDVPRDILYDGARIAALLDIRHLIGPRTEPQERLTHILMDHDLHPVRQGGDYLIPNAESPLWQTLQVSDAQRRSIQQRIKQIPHEALSQRVSWSGEAEVWVGRHKISCRPRDIQALDARWVPAPKDERKPLEIARLLALYSVFDNPLSNRRNGVHLGLDPEIRRHCDFELFASPLNAAVANGRFSSKWPHIEWRFGSIGSYPSVIDYLPVNSVVCINPPFTEAYLADVMARLAELKLRFRLRIAVPILDVPWRKKLQSALPSPQLLKTYYDASCETQADVLHPTLLWEDPRCPPRPGGVGCPSGMGGGCGGLGGGYPSPWSPDPAGAALAAAALAAAAAAAASGANGWQVGGLAVGVVGAPVAASVAAAPSPGAADEEQGETKDGGSEHDEVEASPSSPPLNPQEWPSLDLTKDRPQLPALRKR